MRKSGKRSLMTFAILLSLFACGPSPSPEEEATPVQVQAPPASYNLKIVFRGLIGFAEDSGKIWALLVDAEYVPEKVAENDLPPGMYHELGGDNPERPANWWETVYRTVPPHDPLINFVNAKISGCALCKVKPNGERTFLGADLHLQTDNPGQAKLKKLGALVSADEIKESLGEDGLELEGLVRLDQLDAGLLDPLPTAGGPLDSRLVARVGVEISQTDEISANLVPDKNGITAEYYFNSPGLPEGCDGVKTVKLAEEVVIIRRGIIGPVTLRLGPSDEITVEPDGSGQDVVINILNKPRMDGTHPEAHRWLYRLLDSEGQTMLKDHFYPCRTKANQGPPDCPQKLFVTVE